MSDLSADNPNVPGDDDRAALHIRVEGDLHVGFISDLCKRDE